MRDDLDTDENEECISEDKFIMEHYCLLYFDNGYATMKPDCSVQFLGKDVVWVGTFLQKILRVRISWSPKGRLVIQEGSTRE
jgi:hypothetical protein